MRIEGITTLLSGLPGIVMPFMNRTLGDDLRPKDPGHDDPKFKGPKIKDLSRTEKLSILRDVAEGLKNVRIICHRHVCCGK